MPSFGEKLKQEREKRKITLEQISSSTKIGTRMLQALEEDKFNQLPGGIFNKGFVRAYARFVGLDEDQTVADYLQASGDAPPPPAEIVVPEGGEREPAENIRRMEASSDSPSRPLPWGWFAGGLLGVALALSLWSHQRREHTKPPVHSNPSTVATPVSGASSTTASNAALNTVSGPVAEDIRGDGSPNSSSAPSTLQSQPALGGAFSNKAPSVIPPASQSPAPQDAAPGEFVVSIKAREESWVSVIADGKTRPSELLAPGDERAIRGRKEVIVKIGNAGGIDLRFNGKKFESGGDFGEVKTVTFGPGGQIQSAPPPPSTP